MSEHEKPAKLTRRRFLQWGTVSGLTLFGAAVWGNSYNFELSQHEKMLTKLKQPIKIAHLSDIHFGRWVKANHVAQWVDAVIAEQPDIVVLTGDFIDYSSQQLEPLIEELGRLKTPLGVYGVWGNHDYDQGRGFRNELRDGLSQVGIRILQNEGISLRDDLYLAGIDDIWNGNPNLARALLPCPDEQACLLMAHIPDVLPDVPKMVDVTFCGHTHGGQVKLPIIGAVATSSAFGKRFLEGWIQEPVTAYVSRGLGMVTVPLRFLSTAEIAVFEFLPEA